MRRTALAILAASILPASTPALAQNSASGAPAGFITQQASTGPLLNTHFAGGSIADYVGVLKRVAGDDAPTIMVRGDADAVSIAPVDLRQIYMFSALRLLEGSHTNDAGQRFLVESTNVASSPGNTPAFLVTIHSSGRSSGAGIPGDFLVLPIQELTTPLPGDPPEVVVPAETVLTAVETALELSADGGAAPEMRYHAESGLLILAGPKPALEAAARVVGEISSNVRVRRDRARDLQRAQGLSNPDQLEQQLADARAEAELSMVRLQSAADRFHRRVQAIDELKLHVENGTVPAAELREAEVGASEAQASMREQEIMVERAEQRVRQVEKSLERARQINAGAAAGSEVEALRAENDMLRDRLAVLEAQIRALQDQSGRQSGRPGEQQRGGSRTGGSTR